MVKYALRTRRWTRLEYDRLIDAGFFQPHDPIELLGGEMIVSEPQGSEHHTAVGLVEDALRATLGPGWLVRSQGPIALDDESEPEPDVAVVPGSRRDYSRQHPSRPVLVVEVSESSLRLDREHKIKNAMFIDSDTGSAWSAAGVWVGGQYKKEMQGSRLLAVPVQDHLYWGVMKFWYPDLQLAAPEDDKGKPAV